MKKFSSVLLVVVLVLSIGILVLGVSAQEPEPLVPLLPTATPEAEEDDGGKGHPWAQVSGQFDQPSNGVVVDVSMETDDGHAGVILHQNGVEIQRASTYFVVVAGQTTSKYSVPKAIPSCAELWLTINGVDVPNSNTKTCLDRFGETSVLVSQSVLSLEAGDVVGARFYSAQYHAVVLDQINSAVGPSIPSVIVSVVEAR